MIDLSQLTEEQLKELELVLCKELKLQIQKHKEQSKFSSQPTEEQLKELELQIQKYKEQSKF